MRLNNEERRLWVLNDEGLYNWWKRTGLSLYEFIRRHHKQLDGTIDMVLSGKKPAHFLAYGG